MPSIILRLGYACVPRRRPDVITALRLIDSIGARGGWPPGRYLLVDTRASGDPDLEVEYQFATLADLEKRETRLRDLLRTSAREGGPDTSGWQANLLAPGSRRLLTALDPGPEPALAAVVRTTTETVDPLSEDEEEAEPDDEEYAMDGSSLIHDGPLPERLTATERQSRLTALLRDAPGVHIGFGTKEPRSPSAPTDAD